MKTLRQFEVVAEIVRQESISKAAEVLQVSQPTISKILHNLEEDLGLELFDRTVMPLKLTPAGKRYMAAAEKIIEIDHQLEKELGEIRTDINKVLTVGISPSRAGYILPDILMEYRRLNPSCRIVIKEKDMRSLNDDLARGDVDVIISLLTDDTRGFMYEPLFTETVLLAVPEDTADIPSADILKNGPVITIGKGLSLWKLTENILKYMGGAQPLIECQTIESALSLVKRGLGAMLVPSYIADSSKGDSGIVFKQLPEDCRKRFYGDLQRKTCAFFRSHAFLTQSEAGFIDVCKKAGSAFDKNTNI